MTETPLDHALRRIHDLERQKAALRATVAELQETLRLVCTHHEHDAVRVLRKLLSTLENAHVEL